jgi:hypothetical protein
MQALERRQDAEDTMRDKLKNGGPLKQPLPRAQQPWRLSESESRHAERHDSRPPARGAAFPRKAVYLLACATLTVDSEVGCCGR